MNNERPYTLYAQLDADRHPRWWIRNPDGSYTEWQPLLGRTGNLPNRTVAARRLVPVRTDFEVFTGDPAARVEVHNARNDHQVASARRQ